MRANLKRGRERVIESERESGRQPGKNVLTLFWFCLSFDLREIRCFL